MPATAANKLVFQDKVKFIIGNAVGATCNAAQTVTEPQKVLFAFVCWGTNNLGPDKPYSFRACSASGSWPSRSTAGSRRSTRDQAGGGHLPNDTSGKDTNTAVVKALKALGFEVVADEYYERGTKDFYPILTKILAQKPDMIDVAAAPAGEAGLILKQAHELGFKGAKGWTAGTDLFTLIRWRARSRPRACGARPTSTSRATTSAPRCGGSARSTRSATSEVPGGIAVGQLRRLRRLHQGHASRRESIDPDKVLAALTGRSATTPCGARSSSVARRPTASTASSCIPWSSARCATARWWTWRRWCRRP